MDEAAQHEAEKKELTRLLGTAKDEERKEVIRKAIAVLDSAQAGNEINKSDKYSPIGSGNYAHLMSNQKIPLDKMKAAPGMGGMRPLSARNRSTSNLEVIHENASHLAEARRIASTLPISPIPENCTYIRLSSQDCLSCVKITTEEVEDIVATSFDPRFPIERILPGPNRREEYRWTSTGLLPQVVAVHLSDMWFIRQVEVSHFGIKKITVTFSDSLRRKDAGHLMMAESDCFIYSDRKEDSGILSSRTLESTNLITFVVSEIDTSFCSIGRITIFAEKDGHSLRKCRIIRRKMRRGPMPKNKSHPPHQEVEQPIACCPIPGQKDGTEY